jgi:2'-5' RNA ligase
MADQLELLEPPSPPPFPKNRLFLGLFPDAAAVQHISGNAPGMCSDFELSGRLRPPHHFHITVHWFGDYVELPGDVIQSAGEVCELVTSVTPAFQICFDRAVSFRGKPGNHPFVLIGDEHPGVAIMKFQSTLRKELLKRGCPGKGSSSFKPHLTMLYDKQKVEETPIEPVIWAATEIVLIHSEVGATKYRGLGTWKFRG